MVCFITSNEDLIVVTLLETVFIDSAKCLHSSASTAESLVILFFDKDLPSPLSYESLATAKCRRAEGTRIRLLLGIEVVSMP